MSKKNIKGRLKQVLIPTSLFFLIIIVWELVISIIHYPEYLLPRPSVIFNELVINFDSLLYHTGITLLEAVIGFVIANILAFIIAVVFAHSKTIKTGLHPFVIALQTTPIIAMAPLLVLWFGTDIGSKIAAAALVSFFPTIVNGVKGLKSVDDEALDLFKSLSATKWQIFTKLKFPNALPYFFSALKTSATLSVIGAIVGEFVGANKGIGYVILVSTYHLQTVKMFTGIIMAAVAGMIFFWLVAMIEKKIVFWQKS